MASVNSQFRPVALERSDVLLGLLLIAYSFVFAFARVGLRFDFFDMSGFLDASYRVWAGQRPYVDFLYNAGPVHLWILAGFFSLAGFGLKACQFMVATQMALAGFATLLLLKDAFRRAFDHRLAPILLGAFCLLQATFFYGPNCFPWYDQTAWLFVLWGLVLINPLNERPLGNAGYLSDVAAGALILLAFASKANVGGIGALLLGAGALVRAAAVGKRDRIPHLVTTSALALGGFALAFLFVFEWKSDFALFFDQTVKSYGKSRLTDFDRLASTFFASLHMRFLLWAAIAMAVSSKALSRGALVLLMGLAGATIFTTWTGSLAREGNIPTLGIQLALVVFLLRELTTEVRLPKWKWRQWFPTGLAALLLGVALYDGIYNTAIIRIWAWQTTTPLATYSLTTPGFEGWKAYPPFGSTFDITVRNLKTRVPADESVAMIGDMAVAVPASGRTPYPGMPFMFHYGDFPRPGPYVDWVRFRWLADPPIWVLHHVNPALWDWVELGALKRYLGIAEYFDAHYELAFEEADVQYYKRKSAPKASAH